jgi:hypothetical protein
MRFRDGKFWFRPARAQRRNPRPNMPAIFVNASDPECSRLMRIISKSRPISRVDSWETFNAG